MPRTLAAGRAPRWTIALAFALVYLAWGTTYFVIRIGVHDQHLPPALFGGVRVGLAGVVLLAFVRFRSGSLRLPGPELGTAVVAGLLLFVGGNGFMTTALDEVPSGVAAVLAATTPLWVCLLESLWPRGEKLAPRGWLGLAAGLGGVLLLYAPELQRTGRRFPTGGLLLILASALSWALGSLVLRYGPQTRSHLTSAAYQMALGGGGLALVGLALGEARRLTPDHLTTGTAATFGYLLVVGSLIGFVAFNYLLGHVSAALVGTYAYVNPLIAVLVGAVLGGEDLTAWTLGGMAVILAGVALVRAGRKGPAPAPDDPPEPARHPALADGTGAPAGPPCKQWAR
jgi:drug/metabolite transporter (DMT)-like permease